MKTLSKSNSQFLNKTFIKITRLLNLGSHLGCNNKRTTVITEAIFRSGTTEALIMDGEALSLGNRQERKY